MNLFLNLVGTVAALWLSFLSSGMETAMYRVSRVRMRVRSEGGDSRARAVLRVLDRLDGMVTTILIDNNIAAYAATFFVTSQFSDWQVPHQELISTAVVTPLFFVLTESLPKQLAYSNADYWALALVRVFWAFRVAFSPVVWVLNRASALLRKLFRAEGEVRLSHSQRDILTEHFSAGVAEQVLTEEQNRMARRIMELEGITAADSMMPLSRLLVIGVDATRREAVDRMAGRETRVALLADRAGVPNGMAVTLGALAMQPGRPDSRAADAAEKLDYIRAGVAIPEVLNLFRHRHARNALVVDKGRVVGLITTMSVLDKIAGITGESQGKGT